MLVQHIMTTNVVTIPSNTSIADAKRILEAHRFRRLPVVDKGKLIGIVTERGLEQVSPSKATSLTVWELSYLLNKTTVKEIMEKNVVTVSPDMTAEEALALAQSHKVGALIAVEDGRIVGIVTTNDFFYKIVNPVLGIGEPGHRILVIGGGESKALEDILSSINKLCIKMTNLHIQAQPEGAGGKDVVVHVECEDINQLVKELESKKYKVMLRKR